MGGTSVLPSIQDRIHKNLQTSGIKDQLAQGFSPNPGITLEGQVGAGKDGEPRRSTPPGEWEAVGPGAAWQRGLCDAMGQPRVGPRLTRHRTGKPGKFREFSILGR